MAKDLGLCCPLCLGVDDPAGMLSVKIHHLHPPGEREIYLCIACFSAVIEAAREQNELINGRGDFGDGTVAQSSSVSKSDNSSAALPGVGLHPDRPAHEPSFDLQPDAASPAPATD